MHPPPLTELERRAYRTVVDDGLLDLAFGIFLLSFWVSELLPFDGFPGIAFLLTVYGWAALRRTIVEPRAGTVRLSATRKARVKRAKRWMVLLIGLPVAAVFIWVVLLSSAKQPLGGYGSLVIAGIFALALAVGGWMLELLRFWLYAAVLLAAGLWATLVSEPFERFQFVATGAVAVVSGALVLARFLRRYPPPSVHEGNHAETAHD